MKVLFVVVQLCVTLVMARECVLGWPACGCDFLPLFQARLDEENGSKFAVKIERIEILVER